MAHKVFRLANKHLYNKPLLSSQDQLEELVSYIDSREFSQNLAIASAIKPKIESSELGEGDIGVIPISGALTYESTGWEALCGMTSYEALLDTTRAAIKAGYTTLVFDVDSGGGEAYGCFETGNDIKRLTKEAGVKTLAYVDGQSCSAAYALASCMDEVIANPQSEVGSIGVVTRLRNTSERDKKEGVSTTYVYAGDSKIPFDANGDFSEDFKADLQSKVDKLYDEFLNHVSEMRGIEKEAVRSTQAKVFTSDKAKEVGFVDSIMTRSEFAEYLADIQEKGNKMSLKSLNLNVQEEQKKMQLEEMQTNLEAAVADKESALSELAATNDKVTELTSQLEELQLKNAELLATFEEVEKSLLNEKLEARKEKLSNVISEDKLDAIFDATKSMDDAAFNVVLSGYEAQAKALDNSELFNEAGVDGEGDSSLSNSSSKVLELIQQRKNAK